ncbi:MAG: erythronolide synthase, Aspartate racemase [Bacteroidetes bacterium]|nr:erythronolide synthase, Aspartate racemase [Bacteroidota bacterium]
MDIAIIGVAGRFPEATTIEELYQNLAIGKDSIRAVSIERKKSTTLPLDKEYQTMGYMEDVDKFDHHFFGISKAEAIQMDPHQRLLMETVYETIESAGYNADHFSESRTALFAACPDLKYYQHLDNISQADATTFTGNMSGMTAGRIARFFNLYGNAQVIDTSCSSSLVAVSQACNELILKNADYAFACGVQLWLFPGGDPAANPNDIGISAMDGKVKAFSENADGTNNGEAVGCVLLKPLDKAIADKDVVYAVIKGTAVNQDAQRSSFLTAPSSIAQAEVIQEAWKKAGIKPESVTMIEAHGTGTKIGDPIEIKGLELAYASFTDEKQFVALSALKTNIGHAAAASGIAGLIKAVLSLKHKKIFPTVHFTVPNPFIDFAQAPVYVNTQFKDWIVKPGELRRAGVSSFGLTGTNCHIVLEEAPVSAAAVPVNKENYLFTVSAKDEPALQANIKALAGFLEKKDLNMQPEMISYSLNAGKKHYRHRKAFIGNDLEQLVSQLKAPVPEILKYDEVVFLLSDKLDISLAEINAIAERYSVFGKCFAACAAVITEKQNDPSVITFVFHYCIYKLLESKGIKPVNLLGVGAGQLAVAVITGRRSLNDALSELQNSAYSENGLEDRLRAYKGKITAKRTAFVEIGTGGAISSVLAAVKTAEDLYAINTISVSAADPLPEIFRLFYLLHYDIDWKAFYDHAVLQRVALPAYQFTKTRCWIKEIKESRAADWLYQLEWQKVEIPAASISLSGKNFIVFADKDGIAAELSGAIEMQGGNCINVYKGKSAFNEDKNLFINWQDEEDYIRLRTVLAGRDIIVSGIIDLWGTEPGPAVEKGTEELFSAGLYCQLYITKAFDELISQKDFIFLAVSNYARIITGKEKILYPHRAASFGYISSLSAEYPGLKIKCLDLDPAADIKGRIRIIVQELRGSYDKLSVGYRNNERYLPGISSFNTDVKNTASVKFREGGVYLITGGSSGIGLEICKDLGKKYKLNLVVIGRKKLQQDKKSSWKKLSESVNDPNSQILRTFAEIEEGGSKIHYFAADLADRETLGKAVKDVVASVGPIKGVLHAAGIPGKMRAKNHTLDSFREALEPKVHGSVHLANLVDRSTLDFFVLFSSHSSFLGIARTTNYSAANMFQDNYAYTLREKGINAISINWPSWKDTGMWHRISDQDDHADVDGQLGNSEGLDVFYHLLDAAHANVIVSKYDPGMLRDNPYFHVEAQTAGSGASRLYQITGTVNVVDTAEDDGYEYNDALTETENKIAAIWRKVLKTDIKPDDDFFELGGHSLNGAQVINQVEKLFAVEMEFGQLLDHSTIRQLAKHIDSLRSDTAPSLSVIPVLGEQAHYEVSHSQERMWFINRVQKESLAYNMIAAFEVTGMLDAAAMKTAFDLVVRRHESLRTVLMEEDGLVRQKINAPESISLEMIDATGSGQSFEARYKKEATRIFDLEKGPLTIAALFKIRADQHYFLLNAHHIITDGWSMNVLLNEIKAAYNYLCEGRQPVLSALPYQYKDFATWQNTQIAEGSMRESKAYWEAQFSTSFPPHTIEPDHHEGRDVSKTINKSIVLNADTTQVLRAIFIREDATMFMGIVAFFNLLLFRYTGRTDIVVGFPVAGRNRADQENQLGLYVNTLALRTRFVQEDTFLTLLSKVKKVVLSSFQHQEYPFDLLLSHIQAVTKKADIRLFNVMIVYQSSHFITNSADSFHNLEMKWIGDPVPDGKFDLTFIVTEDKGALKIDLQYESALFKEATIEMMSHHIIQLFADLHGNELKKINEFEFGKTTLEHSSNDITTQFNF